MILYFIHRIVKIEKKLLKHWKPSVLPEKEKTWWKAEQSQTFSLLEMKWW